MTKVTRLTLDSEGGLDRKRIHLREISDEMDAPLDTVGQDLRAARLRRGDDLASVSRVLKIRKDHLEALEEDRIEALPGRTYAVGFIRSYADYLGLDAVQCVERFKAEIAGRADASITPITVIDEDAEQRMPHGWKIMAGVVVLLVLYGAYQLAASADKMVNEPTVAPAPVVQRPVAHKTATVTQQLAPPLVMPPLDIATQQGGTALVGDTVAATVAQPTAEPSLPQGQVFGDLTKPARVILRAHEATRILIQGTDGRVYQNRLLKPGDSYRMPNIPGLTITTANAGALEVTLDGSPMGRVGLSQETTEALSLDVQSIQDRYNGSHN